jgi:hypothetical protein
MRFSAGTLAGALKIDVVVNLFDGRFGRSAVLETLRQFLDRWLEESVKTERRAGGVSSLTAAVVAPTRDSHWY